MSLLNRCDYCLEHHFAGLRRLLNDDDRADTMLRAMEADDFGEAFDAREAKILRYAKRLTRDPASISETDIQRLRSAGLEDGEILEVNQVAAYFAYANRHGAGLGWHDGGRGTGSVARAHG